jgi:hypothetical protein
MNLKCVKSWFTNTKDPMIHSFFSTNMQHNNDSQVDVKKIIQKHHGTLG